MVRLQIQLTEEQAARLRRLAAERRVSVAALVREAVDQVVRGRQADDPWQRALSVVGKHHSGRVDVAREHDRELAEIYAG
jgi:class 3 adenylate cyclase